MSDLWECYEPEEEAGDDGMEPDPEFESIPCPTCKGRGTVNPLTTPDWHFCTSTTTCPTCEGTGEFE